MKTFCCLSVSACMFFLCLAFFSSFCFVLRNRSLIYIFFPLIFNPTVKYSIKSVFMPRLFFSNFFSSLAIFFLLGICSLVKFMSKYLHQYTMTFNCDVHLKLESTHRYRLVCIELVLIIVCRWCNS